MSFPWPCQVPQHRSPKILRFFHSSRCYQFCFVWFWFFWCYLAILLIFPIPEDRSLVGLCLSLPLTWLRLIKCLLSDSKDDSFLLQHPKKECCFHQVSTASPSPQRHHRYFQQEVSSLSGQVLLELQRQNLEFVAQAKEGTIGHEIPTPQSRKTRNLKADQRSSLSS